MSIKKQKIDNTPIEDVTNIFLKNKDKKINKRAKIFQQSNNFKNQEDKQ